MRDSMSVLGELFLFAGMTAEEKEKALAYCHPEERAYRRGECLFTPRSYSRVLVLIRSGRCDVLRQEGASSVTIKTLSPGYCFGVVSLFSCKKMYPTTVIARKETHAMLLPREDVERMIAACPQVGMNLIRFLTARVEFLNERVVAYAGSSVEKRLASWLLQSVPGDAPFPLNRKLAAETLGCGRASLYRALDSLQEKRLISLQDKDLIITNRMEMERMIQS